MKNIVMLFLLQISLSMASENVVSIFDLMDLAYNHSNDYEIYKIQKELNVRNFQSAMNSYNYSLDLTFQPQYSHSISPITQSNGTIVNHDIISYSITPTINFSVPVCFTGGSLAISSNLNYFSSKNAGFHSNGYSVNLFHVNYSQPIQLYNSIKWGKKNVRANYRMGEYDNLAAFIKLRANLCNAYFNVLRNRYLVESLKKQILNLDTLVTLYSNLHRQGKIIKTELDAIVYNRLEMQSKVVYYKKNLRHSTRDLNNYLNNIIDVDTIELQMPPILHQINIDTVSIKLIETQSEYYRAAKVPLEKNMVETKNNRGVQLSFNVGLGMNSSSENISTLFNRKSPNVNFSVSAKLPISDLKERKNQYEIAKLQWQKFQISKKKQDTDDLNKVEQLVDAYNYTIENMKLLHVKDNYLNEELTIKLLLLKKGKILFDEYDRSYQKTFENIDDKITTLKKLYNEMCSIELLTFYDFINNIDYRELLRMDTKELF